MPFLLLLLLTLTCLQQNWPEPIWESPLSVLFTWGGIAMLVGRADYLVRRVGRQIQSDPTQRSALMKRFHRQRRKHVLILIGFQVMALYFLGWGWTAARLWAMPGVEILLLAPFFIALFVSWAIFYDLERLSHQTVSTADDDPYMSRWAYVGLQARHNLLLIMPPLCLLVMQQILLSVFPGLKGDEYFTPIFAIGLLLAAFICIPWLLRVFLGLTPLPDGPLRERLLATARRLNFRFNDILLWDTRDTVANAMVTGFVPFLRYVVVTDRLIRELRDDEVEAVFGHEVGHIKHHHMLYYLVFLLASLVVVGGVWNWGGDLLKQSGLMGFLQHNVPWLYGWLTGYEVLAVLPFLVLLTLYIFLVFGFLSRRCERQADIFGCRTVNCQVFINALEKVAVLNGIPRDKPGWLSSWQHATIAQRVSFLERMDADPAVEPQFQRRVGMVKWGIAFGLAAVLIALGADRVLAVLKNL